MSSTLVYGKNAPIVTCSNCECQFKYSTVDIFIDNAMVEDGRFVRCPECGQVNPATTQYFDPRGDYQFNPSETYPNMGVGKDDQGNIITETYATKVALQEEITTREEVDTEIYSKLNSAISSIQYSTDANDITRLSYTTFDSSPNTAIDIIINKATTTTSGLMPKEAVQEIADLSERVSDLEGPTRRYLYTDSDNPTAEDINDFAISVGLSAPFSGIAVVVASTLHIWHYYTNGGWRDDGKDTVQTANQTTLGIVMGSTDNGKVFVETDGTMSLNGYDDITQNISDINSNLANYVTTNTTQTITAQKYFTTTDGVGAITIQNGDERLFSDGTQISYTSTNVSKSVAFNAGGNGTYRLYFPEQDGILSTLNDITSSLYNYATLDTIQTITARKDFREIGTNIPLSVFNYEDNKYLYLHPTYLSTYDGVTLNPVNMYFPNTSGTLATTESIANSYVTLNTTQNIYGDKYFHYNGSGYPLRVYMGDDAENFMAIGPHGFNHVVNDNTSSINLPNESGTIALTSDIETALSPVQDDISALQAQTGDLSQSVNDIYTILQQEVYTSQDITQEYSSRETADGADIIDGALATLKTVQGATVKTTNLIPFPYLDTTKTTGGVTFTNNGDGSVTINGTASTIVLFIFCSNADKMNLLAGTTYYFTCAHGILAYTDSDGTHYISAGSSFTWGTGWTFVSIYIQLNEGDSETNLTVYPMLNEGSTASPYMPYFTGLKNAYFQGLKSTGRNLIPFPYFEGTTTKNGVTFTVNDDGSVTANGTATSKVNFFFVSSSNPILTFPIGTVLSLTGCQSAGSVRTFFLNLLSNDYTEGITDIGNGGTLTTTKKSYYLYFRVEEGVTLTNVVIRPMLNYGSTALPYEPYVSHEISIDTAIELPAWDSIDLVRGKRTVQSNTLVFDGTEIWFVTAQIAENVLTIGHNFSESYGTGNYNMISTIKIGVPATSPNDNVGCSLSNANYSAFIVWFRQSAYPNITDLASAKAQLAAWNTAGDPLTVCYQTATATESDISMEDRLPAYKKGSETVIQGDTDNSEYGAENTLTQNYAEVRGATGGN